ncbi:MAG: PBP1A family penicillin-binding protein [Desulfobacterales bacterium]|jgi:penicillin-binding protein 1B
MINKKRPIRIKLEWLLKWFLPAALLVGGSMLLYCLYVSSQIDKRFSARRWSIPSRVFSDVTILYPGQNINRSLFYEKLHRLGYRAVLHEPHSKGEFHTLGPSLELFLHDFEMLSVRRGGICVQIKFVESMIESIININNGEPIPILELEPEEVMLFFGHDRERRRLVSIDQIPQHVIYAVLAAEDSRFYQHRGLDPMGTLRALYTNLRYASIRQGGSTITQQLAKNYFLTPERTFFRKVKELFMSLTMEIMYEKNEILEIYLNEIYLGQKASDAINGIGEASFFYFDKPVEELSLIEGATIACLIKGPNFYSPYIDKTRCKNRRNLVLYAMKDKGWISDEELGDALLSPVNAVGYESYGKKAPYFIDYLAYQLTTLYSPQDLSSLGLSIYTTLDTQVQMAAEKALQKGLVGLERSNPTLIRQDPTKKLQGAIIVMQPKTGYILAMVGGRNYNISQFNRITQARRQPGSAFKPFVYVSGLDKFTPASILSNKPKTYEVNGTVWEPKNYAPVLEEKISVRSALAKSINLGAVDLAMRVGLDHIAATANLFGFSIPANPYPSLSLGAYEVIPLNLARAYCAFAADGVLPFPLSLKEVLDENGKILEQRHTSIKRVISPAKAFVMSSMLWSVVKEGTAHSLKDMGIWFPVGGKTGTTNNFKDAWFVGYTPNILALVWVGFDDGSSVHASGAGAALPIWAELMSMLPQFVSGSWFKVPPGVVKRTVCSESGQRAVKNRCPHPVEEYFLADNVPKDYCPIHRWGSTPTFYDRG